jgi:hypothetical protein
MEELIKKLLESHFPALEKNEAALMDISKLVCRPNSTGLLDCRFLELLVFEHKPKVILEIGTWVGMTAYSMALASSPSTVIHTIDNNNEFIDLKNESSKKIVRYPNTFSYNFLPSCTLKDVDMIFNDANISLQDCKDIYKLASSNFIFATHDYFNSSGGYEKGYDAIELMKRILNENDCTYSVFTPKKEWYFENQFNVNGCTAVIIVNKSTITN